MTGGWLAIGLGVGGICALTQRWAVSRLRSGPSIAGGLALAAGFLLRMGLTTALLIWASRHGLVAGLLAGLGLWLACWMGVLVTLSSQRAGKELV